MKSKFTLKTYLIAALAEGIISLFLLLLIPSDPKNVWLLGMSKSRIVMLAAGTLTVAVFALLVVRATKDETRYARLDLGVEKIFQYAGHLTTGLVFSLAGFLGGSYFLYTTITTTDLFVKGYFIRLAPCVFWLTMICGQSILFINCSNVDRAKKYFRDHGTAIALLFVILLTGLCFHANLWDTLPEDWDINKMFNQDNKFDLEQQDIYQVFTEGDRLQHGQNPYSRALDQDTDLQWNQQNATYLPIFYILTWLTQEAGLEDYLQYLSFWRVIFLIFNLAIAYLLFYIPYHRHNTLLLGCFAALLWLFNRWTVNMTMIYHIDFIAIFFLLWSLVLWPKYKTPSFLAFGLSLGVKQMAIFMIPIYLIWAWQSNEKRSIRQFIIDALIIGSIPLIVSTPFLIWNAKGFLASILISATRNAESHFGVPSIDILMGLSGIPAKLPMVGMMTLTFILVWKQKINQ
ncbi:MAG: hypothetical protein KKD28_02395, partial [Chloroflexi bacterium]|nr:hypothetical protein [Chloroflexota bacterium]